LNEDEKQLSYQLQCEIAILKQPIKSQSCKPFTTLEETLIDLGEIFFPTIAKLALIHYSLPVSVASDKRSFSNLKKLKTYLRNRMSQERLSGLALLNINRKIDINIDDVIDRFANSGSRKLEFLLK
jgi:hAT family C-terminal dimerisation region